MPDFSPTKATLARVRAVALSLLIAALTACGGGGGGGGGAPAPVNQAPQASAGAAQTVFASSNVVLDGSASRDPDGSISSWRWEQSSGPGVILLTPDQPQATFTAPATGSEEELVFSLTVTDNGGATANDSVSIVVQPQEQAPLITVSGRILPSASQTLDGDTNDPGNPLAENDTIESAQPVSNPVTLGGYVNVPGAGAEGRSQAAGDLEDFFRVALFAEQTVTLLVAEFETADADLYLYDPAGNIVDFSIDTDDIESIVVPADGEYLVNVSAFDGATSYTLAIGSSAITDTQATRSEIIPGEVILTWKSSSDLATSPSPPQSPEDLLTNSGLQMLAGANNRELLLSMTAVAAVAQQTQARLGRAHTHRAHIADPALRSRWDTLITIKTLQRHPLVKNAAPNYRVRALANTNDESFPLQWHYPLIGVPSAWDTTTGNPDVVVAVIDTGVLGGHPDLAGQLLPGYDFIRSASNAGDGDGIDADPEETVSGAEPGAVNFHGTHVKGTIAARGNNRIGVAGVAYGSRLLPLRALGASGGSSYDVAQALRYAAGLDNDSGTRPAQPADIINLSIGGEGFSQSTQNLYQQLRDAGIIVVAAAGNESSSAPSYPAAYDGVFSVSAVDAQGNRTSYSNRGSTVDLAAPGGDSSRDLTGDGYPDGVLSTGGADGEFAYTFISGTSMASPHVAGVFALMKSINPELSAVDMENLLQAGELTDDKGAPGRDDNYGYGLINARKAVSAALQSIGQTIEAPLSIAASSAVLNFGSTQQVLELVISANGNGDGLIESITTSAPWLTIAAVDVDAAGLGRYEVRVERAQLAPGVYAGELVVNSNANKLRLKVIVSVGGGEVAELGNVYILLFDPERDEAVGQAVARLNNDAYAFRISGVPAGAYQLFAGTDLDNDLLICDSGEACGAYLTIDQPLLLELDSDREELSFPVDYLISIPSSNALNAAGGNTPRPLKR